MKFLLFACLFIFSSSLFAQKANTPVVYLLDASLEPARSESNAYFLTEVSMINDTCWQWDTYHIAGPMFASEQFKDRDATIPHGRFIRYNMVGYIDSSGNCVNGLLDGDWYYYNEIGDLITKKKYKHGRLISVEDNIKKTPDTLLAGEVESEFPGGLKSWQRYLTKNTNVPNRAVILQKEGEVHVRFRVKENGSVDLIHIFRSVEYSLDKEAIRIIQNSPKWTPGKKDGIYVNTYKVQPFHFSIPKE